ncbi:SDR family NAD(P)-dependent oxidoreductase [Granulicella cerasi]|uniref:SDR family NAD(P)-dependent oxidoreductase n=1 Tax=Granulicella cerasi TaxID=741063 RepID=A0ABW1ZCV7_9BACT|nr:SDR family NAD(P)-dependent oxidoreductase [Granulicella cerasi]
MKTWLITGASRGMGRVWAEAALLRGDNVAAIARTTTDFKELSARFGDKILPLAMDVSHPEQVAAGVAQAHQHFGQLDIVINNAGYPLVATIEEASDDEIRALYDTNILGTVRVIRAVLPILRKQGHGHIIGVSSTLALQSMPLIGFYASSKWAFEAIHESLALEVAPFGLKVSIIEPGAYATDFGGPQSGKHGTAMPEYAPVREHVFGMMRTMQRAEPAATADAVLKLVDAEQPPLRLILGSEGVPHAHQVYARRLAEWDAWEEVSASAQGQSTTAAGH